MIWNELELTAKAKQATRAQHLLQDFWRTVPGGSWMWIERTPLCKAVIKAYFLYLTLISMWSPNVSCLTMIWEGTPAEIKTQMSRYMNLCITLQLWSKYLVYIYIFCLVINDSFAAVVLVHVCGTTALPPLYGFPLTIQKHAVRWVGNTESSDK